MRPLRDLILTGLSNIAQDVVTAQRESEQIHLTLAAGRLLAETLLSIPYDFIEVLLLAEIHKTKVFFVLRSVVTTDDHVVSCATAGSGHLYHVLVGRVARHTVQQYNAPLMTVRIRASVVNLLGHYVDDEATFFLVIQHHSLALV